MVGRPAAKNPRKPDPQAIDGRELSLHGEIRGLAPERRDRGVSSGSDLPVLRRDRQKTGCADACYRSEWIFAHTMFSPDCPCPRSRGFHIATDR